MAWLKIGCALHQHNIHTVHITRLAEKMSEGESDSKDNLGIAFALVIGAGAATGLGAAVVFVPRLVKLASRKTLAGALGLSAGVMTYVSFVEIFGKATGAFEDAGYDPEKEAYIYGTLCFFAGVVFMVVSQL